MIIYQNKAGLSDWLAQRGWVLLLHDNAWAAYRSSDGVRDDDAVNALIVSYDELPAIKSDKIAAIKADGLARIQTIFPAIADFDMLKLVVEIMQSVLVAARSLTPNMSKAQQIWQAGQDAIAAVNAASTKEQVAAVTAAWPA